MSSLDLVVAAYEPLIALADTVDEERGWTPTRLPGWTVRDLLFHLAGDCQRALVALGTPAAGEPDTDAVTYWAEWKPGTEGAQAGLRGVRTIASQWSSVRGPADLHAETARAVLTLAARADPSAVVGTQGRRLTVDALLRTLAVEAAIHHLDLGDVMPGPPAATALAEVRNVCDGLLGEAALPTVDDSRYALVGTGREPLSDDERRELGPLADRFPLFG